MVRVPAVKPKITTDYKRIINNCSYNKPGARPAARGKKAQKKTEPRPAAPGRCADCERSPKYTFSCCHKDDGVCARCAPTVEAAMALHTCSTSAPRACATCGAREPKLYYLYCCRTERCGACMEAWYARYKDAQGCGKCGASPKTLFSKPFAERVLVHEHKRSATAKARMGLRARAHIDLAVLGGLASEGLRGRDLLWALREASPRKGLMETNPLAAVPAHMLAAAEYSWGDLNEVLSPSSPHKCAEEHCLGARVAGWSPSCPALGALRAPRRAESPGEPPHRKCLLCCVFEAECQVHEAVAEGVSYARVPEAKPFVLHLSFGPSVAAERVEVDERCHASVCFEGRVGVLLPRYYYPHEQFVRGLRWTPAGELDASGLRRSAPPPPL